MTEVTMPASSDDQPPAGGDVVDADEQLVRQLAVRARAEGLQLTGEGGLLSRLMKMVIESAVDGELDDHLGYARHDPAGRDGENSRNGRPGKTVLTEVGPVEIAVPRDRDGSFEPKLVRKHERRLSGVEDVVRSLSAKGTRRGGWWPSNVCQRRRWSAPSTTDKDRKQLLRTLPPGRGRRRGRGLPVSPAG